MLSCPGDNSTRASSSPWSWLRKTASSGGAEVLISLLLSLTNREGQGSKVQRAAGRGRSCLAIDSSCGRGQRRPGTVTEPGPVPGQPEAPALTWGGPGLQHNSVVQSRWFCVQLGDSHRPSHSRAGIASGIHELGCTLCRQFNRQSLGSNEGRRRDRQGNRGGCRPDGRRSGRRLRKCDGVVEDNKVTGVECAIPVGRFAEHQRDGGSSSSTRIANGSEYWAGAGLLRRLNTGLGFACTPPPPQPILLLLTDPMSMNPEVAPRTTRLSSRSYRRGDRHQRDRAAGASGAGVRHARRRRPAELSTDTLIPLVLGDV